MYEAKAATERGDVFECRIREQWAEQLGRPLDILVAGCGHRIVPPDRIDVKITAVDEDLPGLREALEGRPGLDAWSLGDLRSVPIFPRSFDVVHIEFLLERIHYTELVLDRFLTGLRPGGLMLIRMRDRRSAYGFCDRLAARVVPAPVRRALWRRFVGEHGFPPAPQAGPPPAVYEPVTTLDGLRSYCLTRGLRITDEVRATSGPALRGPWGHAAGAACRTVERLSGGRLPAGHDELAGVIRKPHNHFARLL